MSATQDNPQVETPRVETPRVETPRGEIEIIPPGERVRGAEPPDYGFETNAAGRTFVFGTKSGGLISSIVVALGVMALFALLLGTFAVVAGIAVVLFAGFYLRKRIRRLLGWTA